MGTQEFKEFGLLKEQMEKKHDELAAKLTNAETSLKIALERLSLSEGKLKILKNKEQAQKEVMEKLEKKLGLDDEQFSFLDQIDQGETLQKNDEQQAQFHLARKVKENTILVELLEKQKNLILLEQTKSQRLKEQVELLKEQLDKMYERERHFYQKIQDA